MYFRVPLTDTELCLCTSAQWDTWLWLVLITSLALRQQSCVWQINWTSTVADLWFRCVIVQSSAVIPDWENYLDKISPRFFGKDTVIFDFHECKMICPSEKVVFKMSLLFQCTVSVDSILLAQNVCILIYFFPPFYAIVYHPCQSFQKLHRSWRKWKHIQTYSHSWFRLV